MLVLSSATRWGLVLAVIALLSQIPVAIQDLRTRTIPKNSWLRVAAIVTIVVGVVAVVDRIALHGAWENIIVAFVFTLVFVVVMWVLATKHSAAQGGIDVLYGVYCLIPLSLAAGPIVMLGTFAIGYLAAGVIALVQHNRNAPLITGMVIGGWLSLAFVVVLAVL